MNKMSGTFGKVFFTHISLMFLVIFPLFGSAQVYFPPEALSNPQNHKHLFDKVFVYSEIGVFNKSRYSDAVVLENGYAEAKIKNPETWSGIQNKEAFQIDLVFTKYPWNKTDWLTNYYDLLARRLDQLFKLDPALNSQNIQWNLVLQTDCKTEDETKNFFHGIVIRYRGSEPMNEVVNSVEPISSEKAVLKVSSFMDYLGGTRDASVFYAFNIIKKTGNVAVVMDWTQSMQVHSSQAILWHLKKLQESGIKYFTFFNDGNRIPDSHKKIGSTGGIYPVESENIDSLIFLMEHVMQQGNGGDWPENDLEAVITTINHFKDLNEIYLIADNNSGVRDYGLLHQIKIPVNVIVCDAREMINIQYINIAYQTGGNIFVEGQQIDPIAQEIDEKGRFMILKHMYKFDENDDIVPCFEIDRFYFERKAFEERTAKDNKKKIKHKQPGCPQF